MPVTQNSANLATCIDSIQTGGGGTSTKYGVSMDSIIGDVNASGVLQQPSVNGSYVFTGVKDIAITGLQYVGYQKKAIVSVSFPDLENITGMSALYYAFQYSNVASINFPKLETITNDTAMQYAFGYTPLTSASFPELTVITGNNAISYCFAGCSSLTSISFPKLERIGKTTVSQYVSDYGQLARLLYNAEGVETLTFPELKEIYCTGGSAAYSGTFAYNNKVKNWLPIGTYYVEYTAYSQGISYLYCYGYGQDDVSFNKYTTLNKVLLNFNEQNDWFFAIKAIDETGNAIH
jgi:hypothetical protein